MNEKYMKLAIKEAMKAELDGDVPIGCIIVKNGVVISKGRNMREKKMDSTLHAEMVALRKACKKLGDWRLDDCELYVTVEPCPMCAGAIVNSRIKTVYFGTHDTVSGCCDSVFQILSQKQFYHTVEYYSGILEDECKNLMKNFFKRRRLENKNNKNSVTSGNSFDNSSDIQ